MHIDITQILLQLVNFSILLFVLNRFLYKPILKILESRSKKVQAGLEAAEKSLEESAKATEKKNKLLIKAEKQAADILDQARVEAKQASKDIIAVARKEARDSAQKEYSILKAKLEQEEQKVRRNIGKLIAETTTTILEDSLDTKTQRQIIKNQIKHLDKLKSLKH